MATRKSGRIMSALAAFIAVAAVAASGATVTLAPPSGTTTNVLALYTGETSVEIAGPGTVSLNPANTYTGGTTLSGGALCLSGVSPSGSLPIGTGALTITGADAVFSGSGTIANDITATAAFNLVVDGTLTLSGNNEFQAISAISEGTVEISGGATVCGARFDIGNEVGKAATLRVSGGTMTTGGNLQRGNAANTASTLIMTGGSIDIGGYNSVVGYSGGPVMARTDISGAASLRNIGNFYIHGNGGSSSINEVSVHDGGTLGFASFYDSASATTTLSVDGGTLANDNSGKSARTGVNWIRNTIKSFVVGDGGVVFTTDRGSAAGLAQIRKAITVAPGATGESARGVTFASGNWGYYVADNAYQGPTTLKNGAVLFLYSSGTIPSGSVVTIGGGSELCNGGAAKTVTSLVLEDGAVLGFGSSAYALTVTDSIALPGSAKIALYNSNDPTATAKNTAGTYAVLKVPSRYASALQAVRWSCATATSGKSYSFDVSTSGDVATLSMTIADDSSGAISGSSTLSKEYSVASDIVVNNSGTLVAQGNIFGSQAGGSITINNGGTLDASGGYIRPVNSDGNSFHLYLNEGGILIVERIEGSSDSTLASQATATPMFHFNGGTIYPSFSKAPSDGNRYLLSYQAALLGEHGVVIDMTRLQRPDGYTRWVRSSVQGNVNHDPLCSGSDGGITVKGIKGERALVLFGSRFAGSTMNGGIHVEAGGTIALHSSAGTGIAFTIAPDGWLRPYDGATTMNIGDLVLGANGAAEPVRLDIANTANSIPGAVIANSISVLSPVSMALSSEIKSDPVVSVGTYTALVYSASATLDTSLFSSADPAFTLTATEESIADGDYAGKKALVVTFVQNDLALENGATQTLSADATYGDIYIGDFNVAANPSLTVSGGTISANGTLHLAYQPADGASSSDRHVVSYIQNGGEVNVGALRSMYRGGNSQSGRVYAEITLNGGALTVAGDARLGYNQTRQGYTTTLTVNDGASMSIGGDLTLTYYSSSSTSTMAPQGIVNMNGGNLAVAGNVDLSRCVNKAGAEYMQDGGVFLRSGVFSAANFVQTINDTPAQRLVFDGGTYAPNAAADGLTLTGLSKANVAAGGAIVDTSALAPGGIYTIAQNLLHDPALTNSMGEVVADGGFTKRGTGTLALTGANTFTGPTRVEGGILAITNSDAISGNIIVSDAGTLDLSGETVSVGTIAASGLVRNGSLTVTGAIAAADAGSMLAVDGDLTLAPGVAVDFAGGNAEYRPIAAVSGTVAVPAMIKARNASDFNRCKTFVIDGVVYVCPTTVGFTLSVR